MKKKNAALKLAEFQRAALLGAIGTLNNKAYRGEYRLKQCGFAYRVYWESPDAPPIPVTDWITFNEIKAWIQNEKRCLK